MQLEKPKDSSQVHAQYEISMINGEKIQINLTNTFEGLQKAFTDLSNTRWRPLSHFYNHDYKQGLEELMKMDIILQINGSYLIRTKHICTIKNVSPLFMQNDLHEIIKQKQKLEHQQRIAQLENV